MADAFRLFGLDAYAIYEAVERGELHDVWRPARDRRSKQGQVEYPEWELQKLAESLGVTGKILPLPQADVNKSYENIAA